ncbi:hypothetical protein NLU13_4325 [Sarocladium strictum]|uniref:Pyrroline-5-carboxylate reductase n=1 Tax=Sarocladium strictum TaxID=5046 RepID=A0AA39L827_SARSR|nr:hypothetical protein NLU13_4325 [Sarocladium strictum]
MSQLEGNKLAFIGGGNMAFAIISGLVSQGLSKESIIVSEPWEVNRNKVASLGVPTTTDNLEAARDADMVIIAVKPQVCKSVCEEMRSAWGHRTSLPIVLSIAAGITLGSLKNWTKTQDGKTAPIVRAMPNTPALVGEGAVGLFASEDVTDEHKKRLDTLLRSIAKAVEWVDREELLDVVTGLSGSGPAYFFAVVEHLIASATALGLPEDVATRLATQTCAGAGKMLVDSADSPAQLRTSVTSPNGTTHAALETFKKLNLDQIIDAGVKAATERGAELGESLGK